MSAWLYHKQLYLIFVQSPNLGCISEKHRKPKYIVEPFPPMELRYDAFGKRSPEHYRCIIISWLNFLKIPSGFSVTACLGIIWWFHHAEQVNETKSFCVFSRCPKMHAIPRMLPRQTAHLVDHTAHIAYNKFGHYRTVNDTQTSHVCLKML